MNEQLLKLMESAIRNNPQFKSFEQQNRGLSMEEVCRRYGIDPNLVKSMIERK